MRSLKALMRLDGRRAMVTGGAGYVGRAVEESLLELGARVAVMDIDEEICAKRVAELDEVWPGMSVPVACDLLSEKRTRQAARQIIREFSGLDILVHCAGYVGTMDLPGWIAPFAEQSVEVWDEAMRVNLTSAFVLTQEVEEALRTSGHGVIVFFASTYGVVAPDFSIYEGTGMGGAAAYGASKAGLLQFMRYSASILGPDVRVNAITPGGLFRGQPDLFVKRYEKRTQLKRMACEEDLKGAIAYLTSDLSAYTTGHNLVIDGGWTAW